MNKAKDTPHNEDVDEGDGNAEGGPRGEIYVAIFTILTNVFSVVKNRIFL